MGHSGSRRAVGVRVGRGEGRAARVPGPTPDQAAAQERLGRPAHDRAPRPMQHRHGPELQGASSRVRGQTSAGSRLVARGPESWGGHTRGELWPGGPGQARVSCRRNLAPPSSCSGGVRLARTTTLAPGCQGNVSRKTAPPPGRVGAGRARGGPPPLTPRRPGRGLVTGPGEKADPSVTAAQDKAGGDRARGPGSSESARAANQLTEREEPVKGEAARLNT